MNVVHRAVRVGFGTTGDDSENSVDGDFCEGVFETDTFCTWTLCEKLQNNK